VAPEGQGHGPGGGPRLIAEAVAAVRLSGRGAVVVVPDYRDLDRVEAALLQLLPAGDVARLTADDGQTPRYRSFLRILSGAAGVAVGTRSAAYAPVRDAGHEYLGFGATAYDNCDGFQYSHVYQSGQFSATATWSAVYGCANTDFMDTDLKLFDNADGAFSGFATPRRT